MVKFDKDDTRYVITNSAKVLKINTIKQALSHFNLKRNKLFLMCDIFRQYPQSLKTHVYYY